MARIRSLLDDIEGSAGSITFSKQNGHNILRQKVGSNSPAQQNTRSRFKLLADLFRKFGANNSRACCTMERRWCWPRPRLKMT